MKPEKKPKSQKTAKEIQSKLVPNGSAELKPKRLNKKYYRNSAGEEPAKIFINGLDPMPRAVVWVQIDRLKEGNPGHGKGLGTVNELKIDFGPGYRVYYSIENDEAIILLLTAGDKSSQQDDIDLAKRYLANYRLRMKQGGEK